MIPNRLDKINSGEKRGNLVSKKNLSRPRLSLNLHTMPQTADSHFKKWLFLALFIFFLIVLAALIIFWS